MLFRIEDIYEDTPNFRIYDGRDFTPDSVDKANIDVHIASKIRQAVNGSKGRTLLSYSKSLATCLLKYNKYTDNELHICCTTDKDYISYGYSNRLPEEDERKPYSIEDRIKGVPVFNESGCIYLHQFIIDISDNKKLDQYLRHYTGVGKKQFSSPEKDSEVVIMNPPNDFVIKQYMDAVYILYALQLKYRFLCNSCIRDELLWKLKIMEKERFELCPDERVAFNDLISYLSDHWEYEHKISQGIYKYSKMEERDSPWYDPISQFDQIINGNFIESYDLIEQYNNNALSELFWESCGKFLSFYFAL